MNELLTAILAQYFRKLKAASATAWSVLVIVIGLLYSVFSGASGIPLPLAWENFISLHGAYILAVLVIIQEAIKQAKNAAISKVIVMEKNDIEAPRSLMGDLTESALEKALKI